MTVDLNLILQFCLILLVIALTVGAVIFILILLDLKQITKRVNREIKAVTFIVDFLDMIVSGFHLAKRKFGDSGVGRTIKKTLKISKEDE
ncbi:MAG TPA: hypothetical protein VMD02_02800 [Candidatus Omnitrophota bacterium]|nr:hypothetical protein [Candidatus Omnitrophota bacterium]